MQKTLIEVVENAPDFFGIGLELKSRGIDYVLNTSAPMPPMYKVGGYAIINKKHVDVGADDVVVGELVIGKL